MWQRFLNFCERPVTEVFHYHALTSTVLLGFGLFTRQRALLTSDVYVAAAKQVSEAEEVHRLFGSIEISTDGLAGI